MSFAFLLVLLACTGKKRDFGDGPPLSGPFAAGASGVNDEADDALPVDALPVDSSAGGAPGEVTPSDVELDTPVGAVLGAACERDLECASGFCVDGVCCDSRCGELCATCAAPDALGTCSPAPNDEACGALVCPGGTECRGYDQTQLEQNCAAFGECRAGIECASLDEPSGTACQAGTGACDGAGECVVPGKARLGASCTQDTDCGEGHCVARDDGTSICCDSACDGVCQQCSAAGRCTEAPASDERCTAVNCPDDNICRDYPDALTENLCRSFGQCRTALECPYDALRVESSCECDVDGNCNLARGQRCTTADECGLAACAPSLSGDTICCSAACGDGLFCSSDGSRCVECEGTSVRCDGTVELRCDGDQLDATNCANGCTPGVGCNSEAPVGFSCATVACQAGAVCQPDINGASRCCSRDCAAEGKLCAENGSCICPEGGGQDPGQSCLLQLGEPCGPTTAACEAGLTCVDGVCCSEPCAGACESCNAPGSAGQCTFAPGDTALCTTGEQCVARGQCRLEAGQSCGGDDARCVSNNCEAQRDGNGASICCNEACSGQRSFCSRDGSRCVQCESNADCSNGCQNGLCNPPRALGDQCDVASQCASGNCTVIPNTNTRRCCGNCQGGQVCNASGGCECPPGQVPVNGQCRKLGGQECRAGIECQSGNCESAVDGRSLCCATDCGDPAIRRCSQDGSACIDQRGGVGTPCTSDGQCLFGNCFDGVCCDGPCGDVCERCNASGQCVADSSPIGCGTGLECFGRGRCRAPIGGNCSSTACGEGTCVETSAGGGLTCCEDDCRADQFCATDGNRCVECATDTDCNAGEACDAATLTCRGTNGSSCLGNADCAADATCVLHYVDADNDNFAAAGAATARFCVGDGYNHPRYTTRQPTASEADCCDSSNQARPNQTRSFSTPIPTCGGFDYDCNEVEEPAFPDFAGCAGTVLEPLGTCSLPGGGQEGGYASGQGGPSTAPCGSDVDNFFASCARAPGDTCGPVGNQTPKLCH